MNLRNLIPWNSRKESKELSDPSVDPFYELQRDMNRVFDNFFSDFGGFRGLSTKSFAPRINVSENEKEIRIEAELPGLEEKDIDVTLQDDVLILKGERKVQKEDKKENYHLVESSYGSFYRSIALPSEIEKEKIDAHYKNGLMTILIPKSEKASTNIKKISIRKD